MFLVMIDDVLRGRRSNPDLVGTRLLILCSNWVVSVSTSSSFILSGCRIDSPNISGIFIFAAEGS